MREKKKGQSFFPKKKVEALASWIEAGEAGRRLESSGGGRPAAASGSKAPLATSSKPATGYSNRPQATSSSDATSSTRLCCEPMTVTVITELNTVAGSSKKR